MSEKIYFVVLILCSILCRGIIATSPDADIRESSDLLLRAKRVINLDHEGYGQIPIEQVNYMVEIKEDGKASCAGAILSHHTVITAEQCVAYQPSLYKIISGTGYPNQRSNHHNITSKLTYSGNILNQHFDAIALITVEPPFIFGPKTGMIQLYAGPLPAGTHVTVSGWGSSCSLVPPLRLPRKLRMINVPIMDPRVCENLYRNRFSVNYKHICTHSGRQYCARSDLGAPLVFQHLLAGIHVLKPEHHGQANADIFINLQVPDYNTWIRRNIRYT